MKIEVASTVLKDPNLEYTTELISILKDRGDTIWLDCDCDTPIDGVNKGVSSCPDMIIVLGGDGSIMRAARRGALIGVPILGATRPRSRVLPPQSTWKTPPIPSRSVLEIRTSY